MAKNKESNMAKQGRPSIQEDYMADLKLRTRSVRSAVPTASTAAFPCTGSCSCHTA